MNGNRERDVTARLGELEATVRGLTQELVSANERIRQLEAVVEARADESTGAAAGGAAKPTPAEDQAPDEPAPEDATPAEEAGDLDDIIVA